LAHWRRWLRPRCFTLAEGNALTHGPVIEVVASTRSTNADLAARLSEGSSYPEGQWLVARQQTGGRGRLGREWFDGLGNFMGSTVVGINDADPYPASLALVAGLAVHEAVSPHVPPPMQALLKWPNDVLIGGAKLAGILLERVKDNVIVGIGVNLAAAPDLPDRQAVALSSFGPAPDLEHFAERLAACFAVELERWRTYGLPVTISRWLAAAHPVGTPLTALAPDETQIQGTFAGLAEDGALQLRLTDGTTRVIHSGEVMLSAAH